MKRDANAPLTAQEMLRIAAEALLDEIRDIDPEADFDYRSLKLLEQYTVELCDRESEAELELYCFQLAAFLGESVIVAYDGEWLETPDDWAIQLPDGVICFVFSKSKKFVRDGKDESIASMFRSIPYIASLS